MTSNNNMTMIMKIASLVLILLLLCDDSSADQVIIWSSQSILSPLNVIDTKIVSGDVSQADVDLYFLVQYEELGQNYSQLIRQSMTGDNLLPSSLDLISNASIECFDVSKNGTWLAIITNQQPAALISDDFALQIWQSGSTMTWTLSKEIQLMNISAASNASFSSFSLSFSSDESSLVLSASSSASTMFVLLALNGSEWGSVSNTTISSTINSTTEIIEYVTANAAWMLTYNPYSTIFSQVQPYTLWQKIGENFVANLTISARTMLSESYLISFQKQDNQSVVLVYTIAANTIGQPIRTNLTQNLTSNIIAINDSATLLCGNEGLDGMNLYSLSTNLTYTWAGFISPYNTRKSDNYGADMHASADGVWMTVHYPNGQIQQLVNFPGKMTERGTPETPQVTVVSVVSNEIVFAWTAPFDNGNPLDYLEVDMDKDGDGEMIDIFDLNPPTSGPYIFRVCFDPNTDTTATFAVWNEAGSSSYLTVDFAPPSGDTSLSLVSVSGSNSYGDYNTTSWSGGLWDFSGDTISIIMDNTAFTFTDSGNADEICTTYHQINYRTVNITELTECDGPYGNSSSKSYYLVNPDNSMSAITFESLPALNNSFFGNHTNNCAFTNGTKDNDFHLTVADIVIIAVVVGAAVLILCIACVVFFIKDEGSDHDDRLITSALSRESIPQHSPTEGRYNDSPYYQPIQ